jgi:hypothetical protein
MIPLVPDLSAATEDAVHRASETHSKSAKPARESLPVLRLSDEMDVIVLNREFYDPEVRVRGRGKGAADGREDPVGSKAADSLDRSQGHVDGMRRSVLRTRPVGNAGTPAGRALTASAGPAPAPSARRGKGKLSGPASHRLDWAKLSC